MENNKPISPPKIATWLLKLFCRKDYLNEVQGDLLEVFEWRVQNKGLLIARIWYLADVFSALRLSRPMKLRPQVSNGMFFSFIKSSFRNFKRHWSYTFLNVFGLALGMAAALFILEYVSDELSFNQSVQSENIYRVSNDYYRFNKMVYESSLTFSGVGPAMEKDLLEVDAFARMYSARVGSGGTMILTRPDEPKIKFEESHLYFADFNIVDFFDLEVVRGQNRLGDLNTVLLTEEMAKKYFGSVDQAMGNTLKYNDNLTEYNLTITGIIKKPAFNLQIDIDVLISYQTRAKSDPEQFRNDWGGNSFITFVKLNETADPRAVERAMGDLTLRYKPRYAEVNAQGEADRINRYFLTNIQDIHLHSKFQNEEGPIGNANTVKMLQLIALFIVVIAWINFINLTTAKSIDRAKEVGIRKVMGATRLELVGQFFTEAFLINFMALLIGIGMVFISQSAFNDFTEKSLWIGDINLDSFVLPGIVLFIVGTVLSGLYPSLLLSSHKAVLALKGKTTSKSGLGIRRGLIMFQLLFSSLLIISTLTINKQLSFMGDQEMGFDLEQVLILRGPAIRDATAGAHLPSVRLFKERLQSMAGVNSVGTATIIPGQGILRGLIISPERESQDRMKSIERVVADNGFLTTLNVKFIGGKNFDKTMEAYAPIILNRSASEALGFSTPEEAVGKMIFEFNREERVIVGVIEDYHHESLNRPIDPMYYVRNEAFDTHYAIRMVGEDVSNTVEQVEELYADVFPGNPADHYFLDQFFEKQYKRDEVNSRVFGAFALLAVIVACLGLYGLSSFTALQRTKEIGIRKVLGAKVNTIFLILSKEVLVLGFIGFLLAVPVAYYGISRWLDGFAYHIEIGPLLFLLPLLLVLGVTLVAVSQKIIQTALMNPVKSLRYE